MKIRNQVELDNYIKSISCFERISKEKEAELLSVISTAPEGKIRDKAVGSLVEGNLFLVVDAAIKKSRRGGLEVMDLIYEGNLALFNAANKYSSEHSSGASFCTCAYTYIDHAMSNMIRNRLVYLPKIFDQYEAAVKEFEMKNNKEATIKDIATLFKISHNKAKSVKEGLAIKVHSTETLASPDGSWEEIYGKEDTNIDDRILKLDLGVFIKKLDPMHKKIIELVYLNDGLDYVEAGKKLGYSKQYIEIVCRKTMREIKVNLMKAWDKERKTKTKLMNRIQIDALKKKDERLLSNLLQTEEEANKEVYKKVLEHYLGR